MTAEGFSDLAVCLPETHHKILTEFAVQGKQLLLFCMPSTDPLFVDSLSTLTVAEYGVFNDLIPSVFTTKTKCRLAFV